MRNFRFLYSLFVVISIFQGLGAQAATVANKPPAIAWVPQAGSGSLTAPVKVSSVEGITEYRLDNGLRVLLFPDTSKANITTNITYLVGSRHENYGETGMAHFLEHLAFQPSKELSGTDGQPHIVQTLNKAGERFNGTP